MCDCFHLAFPNWHHASSGTGAGRRLQAPEPSTDDDSLCEDSSQLAEGERPRPQGSSPVEEYPEAAKYSDKECEAEHDPNLKSGSGHKTKKSGLGSMFEKRSTPKMSKLKDVHSPESGVIVKTAKEGCAEGLVYSGGGKEGIFIKEVVPESPASKSLKVKEGDQILSATVYFDDVPYEDAIQILEHAQAYKVKLCLKRKPDITEIEPTMESDVIPEEDIYSTDVREQGKTKKRGEARISWPKFPSFGKGRKSRFIRSHSSSEADEQKRLELSPTTSDTESPIKSQDALKGKKKKIKLSALTKRGRISSSEDQDTDAPTTGQTSGDNNQTQESDLLSPESLDGPSRETPTVYVAEDLKAEENVRPDDQNNQTQMDVQKVQHKVELISVDSTLKTTDLTVALADQESTSGPKSPDGKKKKKEKSELKMKILGKDKKKDGKAKSSPKRLKTLGASIEKEDKPETEKTDGASGLEANTKQQVGQHAVDANNQITSGESPRLISSKSLTAQISLPKVELDISDVTFGRKSEQKAEDKIQKGKESKQKQATKKPGPTIKLSKTGQSDITTEEDMKTAGAKVVKTKTTEGDKVKEDPYEKLSKSRVSTAQLPKREDIEIPGMEDMSMSTTAKADFNGHYDETVQMSIDVDSVKEAVSKLPGFKLPQVDTSGVLIREEITVIDANAQRISVKTPTKVTPRDANVTMFDMTASPEIAKTTAKSPKIRSAGLTSEDLLGDIKVDLKKPQSEYETEPEESYRDTETEPIKREDAEEMGKETSQEVTVHEKDSDSQKKSKRTKITMPSFGIKTPDIRIPDIGIEMPKQNISHHKDLKSKTELGKIKNQTGDSTGVDLNIDVKPMSDIAFTEVRSDRKVVATEEQTIQLHRPEAANVDIGGDENVDIVETEMKIAEKEGKGSKFKLPQLGISVPKMKGIDLSTSKKNIAVTQEMAKVQLPGPGMDITLEGEDVYIQGQKMEVEKAELEVKSLEIQGEPDEQANKLKIQKFGIKMPKFKGPELDLDVAKKDAYEKLPHSKAEFQLQETSEADVGPGNIHISIPEQQMDLENPELQITSLHPEGEKEIHGGKFKMPKFGMKMPKIKSPELELSFSKKETGVQPLETKADDQLQELSYTGVSLDVSMPELKTEAAPETTSDTIDVKGKASEVDEKTSRFKMPNFGISLQKPKGPEIDLSLPKKDVHISLPEVEAEVKVTDAHMDTEVHQDVKGPASGFTMTTFELPELQAKSPKIPGELPDMEKDVKPADTGFRGPEEKFAVITDPNIKVEAPAVDVKGLGFEQEAKGSKFKMPHLGFSMPKVKGAKLDVSLSKKEADAILPEPKADVKLLKVNQQKSDVQITVPPLEKPELDVQALDTEDQPDGVDGKLKMQKFGIKMPKVKGPEFNLGLSKKAAVVTEPEAKADFDLPDAETKVPSTKIETTVPEVKVATDDTKQSSSSLKMPNISFSMPKVKGPDISLSLSKRETDTTGQDIEADMEIPEASKTEISVGKAEVIIQEGKAEAEKPELQIKSLQSHVKVEGQGGRFKMPKLGIAKPKVKGPVIDLNLAKREGDETLADAKVEVKMPDTELKEPSGKVEVTAPEIPDQYSVEQSPSRFKMPTLKFPKFRAAVTADIPDMDKEIKYDESTLEMPEQEATVYVVEKNIDIEDQLLKMEMTETEGEGKEGKIKMPKFGISLPKVQASGKNFSMSKKDADIKLPKHKADAQLPEVTEGDVGVADLSVPGVHIEIKPPDMKMGFPKFEGKIDGTLESKVEGPQIIMQQEAAGEVNLPASNIKESLPGVDIKAPQIEPPSSSVKGSTSKFKFPTFKFSKFGVTAPNISTELPETEKGFQVDGADMQVSMTSKDVDVSTVREEVDMPEVEVKEPSRSVVIEQEIEADAKSKKSRFSMPKFSFSKQTVKPSEIDTSLKSRDLDILVGKVEVEGGLEIEMQDSEITLQKGAMPEVDLSLSKKVDDVAPPESEVKLPQVQLKKSFAEVDPKASEITTATKQAEGSPSKFTMPSFKLPKFGLGTTGSTVEVPTFHKDIKTEAADANNFEEVLEVTIDASGRNIEGPSVDIKTGVEYDGKGSKLKLPNLGLSMPEAKGPGTDVRLSMDIAKDIDVIIPEAKAEVKLPAADVKKSSAEDETKVPDIQTMTKAKDRSPLKFKMPTFKLPKFSVGTPSATVQESTMETEVEMDGVDIQVAEGASAFSPTAPCVDSEGPTIDVKMAESEHKVKGSQIKLPSLGLSTPQVRQPGLDLSIAKTDVDVTLPEAKADVSLPDIKLKKPSIDVETKASEIKADKKDTEGSPSKFKMPTFKLPKFGMSSSSSTIEAPTVDMEVKTGGLGTDEVLTVTIAAPSAEVEGPSVDLKTTGSEHEGKGSKFKMPSLGFSAPQAKGPDVDVSISKTDVDVTLPKAKTEVKLPDIKLKKPSIDVETKAPEIKIDTKDAEGSPSKFKMPTFKLPKFGMSSSSSTIEVPTVDMDAKTGGVGTDEVLTVTIAAPSAEVEGPSVDLKTTGSEHEGKGSKFKLPSLGFSAPQAKGPAVDLSISKTDVDVTLPEAKAEVKLPEIKLKKTSIDVETKAPEIKIDTKDAEASSSKFKMPTFKLPKFGASPQSSTAGVPSFDKDIKTGGVGTDEVLTVTIAAPSAEVEGSSMDLKTSGVELEAKASKFKMPSLGFSAQQAKGPDVDFSMSKTDVDVTLPEAKAEVKLPDIKLKKPSIDVETKAPEIKIDTKDVEGSPSKFKMPTFKLPKFGVSTQGSTAGVPSLDKDIKTGGVGTDEVLTIIPAAPSAEVEGPSVDLKTIGGAHEAKGSKFKLPSLGFSAPQAKGPDVDVSISKTDVDMTLPVTKAEVKLPDIKLEKSSIDMETKAPEISFDTKDAEGSPSKFKMPTFKLPKFGMSSSSSTIEAPTVDMDAKAGGIGTDEVLTVTIAAPSAEVEGPSIDLQTTGGEHEAKGSKFKMPSLGFSAQKAKGPAVDFSISKTDVDVTLPEAKAEVKLPDIKLKKPSIDMETKAPEISFDTKDAEGSPSKFKMPTFKLPKFGMSSSSSTIEAPTVDMDAKAGGIGTDEVLTVTIAAPSAEVKGPSIDLQTTGGEHEGKGSKFKMPSLGFSAQKAKGPDVDFSISKTDVDVTLPEAKAEVKLPDIKLKKPSIDMETKAPEISFDTKDAEGSPSKFKMPTFKLPKFGMSSSSSTIEAPSVDMDAKTGGVGTDEILTVTIAEPSAEVKHPSIDLQTTGAEHEAKGSKFKLPSLGFSAQAKGPDVDLSIAKTDGDVTLPEAKAEVKLPDIKLKKTSIDVETKAPQISFDTKDAEGSPSKFKMPTFKLPKFGISSSSSTIEAPTVDMDAKTGGVGTDEVLTVTIAAPSAEVKGPSIDLKTTGGEHEAKGSKFKLPSFGFSAQQAKGPDVDLSIAKTDVDVKLPEAKAEVKLPDVKLKKTSIDMETKAPEISFDTKDAEGSPSKFKMPTFKLPKFGMSSSSFTIEAPTVDMDAKTGGVGTDEVLTVTIAAPSAEVKVPSIDLQTTGGEHEAKGNKFKMPSFGFSSQAKGPDVDLSISKTDVDVTLPEAKADIKLPDDDPKQTSANEAYQFNYEDSNIEGSPSKFKMPTFKLPTFGVATLQASVDAPDVRKDIGVDGEGLKVEDTKAELKSSDIEISYPVSEGDVKEKKKSWTLPRFSFSKTNTKAPDCDINLEVDITKPDNKADLDPLNTDIKESSSTIIDEKAATDVDTKLKKPRFSLPRFSFSKPSTKELEVDESLPTVDVSLPEERIEPSPSDFKVKPPESITELQGQVSNFEMPKMGKDIEITVPEISTEVQIPNVEVKVDDSVVLDIPVEAMSKRPSWTFPKMSFSRTSPKAPDVDINTETTKVVVTPPEIKVDVSQDVDTKEPSGTTLESTAVELDTSLKKTKFSLPRFSFSKASIQEPSVQEVAVKAKSGMELKVHEHEGRDDGQELTPKLPKDLTDTDETKVKEDETVTIRDPNIDVSKAVISDSETQKAATEAVTHGSPSKFKLSSFKMPRLSFSKAKPEEEYIPVNNEQRENQLEMETDPKESPKLSLTSFGEILKTIDAEFDVPNVDKDEILDEVHATKEIHVKDLEAKEKQLKQDTTKSPEKVGWFKFPKFGLSSPSEPAKISEKEEQKDEKSPAEDTGNEEMSPTFSVQSSDAFADVSSTFTSEHAGPSLSSPTKVTVKYTDPSAAAGLGEIHGDIVTSTTRTELISDMPELPEKITILSSGMSSSSEDTIRLDSGKIHVITSNIHPTPETQHAQILSAISTQPGGDLTFKSDADEAAAWVRRDSPGGERTVFKRHIVMETSSERSESKETVITTQITRMFDSSDPISGDTASSLQRLKDSVHSEKMRFFDENDE
ncbi:uncharacterized protein ACNS7B_000601 [Menidia menidia]